MEIRASFRIFWKIHCINPIFRLLFLLDFNLARFKREPLINFHFFLAIFAHFAQFAFRTETISLDFPIVQCMLNRIRPFILLIVLNVIVLFHLTLKLTLHLIVDIIIDVAHLECRPVEMCALKKNKIHQAAHTKKKTHSANNLVHLICETNLKAIK